MGKVDALLFLAPLVEREVDDPAELEPLGVHELELAADLRPRFACEAVHLFRPAEHEEDGVAFPQAELHADCLGTLRADVLGDGPCTFEPGFDRSSRLHRRLDFAAPEDIGEPGLALSLRPAVHTVAKGAAAAALGGNCPHFCL